jgi:replication-associated recombination protein RarA
VPDEVSGRIYYEPSERGYESRIKEYLARARELRNSARATARRGPGAKK